MLKPHYLDEYSLKMSNILKMSNAFTINVHFKHLQYEDVKRLKIGDRKRVYEEYLQSNLKKVISILSGYNWELKGTKKRPSGLSVTVPGKVLHKLCKINRIQSIFIDKIKGMRRKPEKPVPEWYSVAARFICQIENQGNGHQTVEEDIFVFKGKSAAEVERKFRKGLKILTAPYLNTDLHGVTWNLLSIDDISPIWETEIDPNGTEVYWKRSEQRFRKKYFWKFGKPIKNFA